MSGAMPLNRLTSRFALTSVDLGGIEVAASNTTLVLQVMTTDAATVARTQFCMAASAPAEDSRVRRSTDGGSS